MKALLDCVNNQAPPAKGVDAGYVERAALVRRVATGG